MSASLKFGSQKFAVGWAFWPQLYKGPYYYGFNVFIATPVGYVYLHLGAKLRSLPRCVECRKEIPKGFGTLCPNCWRPGRPE